MKSPTVFISEFGRAFIAKMGIKVGITFFAKTGTTAFAFPDRLTVRMVHTVHFKATFLSSREKSIKLTLNVKVLTER
jgi:hypothetical protein